MPWAAPSASLTFSARIMSEKEQRIVAKTIDWLYHRKG
jgi:hypothetical protein